jgi:DNA polymerase-2
LVKATLDHEKSDLNNASDVHQGFVLTRHSEESSNGMKIALWLATNEGAVSLSIEGERPTFFVREQDLPSIRTAWGTWRWDGRPVALKSFSHEPVWAIYTQTQRQQYGLIRILTELNLPYFEQDIRLADRYLMERFICGGVSFKGDIIDGQVKQPQVKPSTYVPQLRCVSLDIECDEDGLLYSIGLSCEQDARVIVIGEVQSYDLPVTIQWVASEKALLMALEDWFEAFDPDVILGWNVIDFDFRRLMERSTLHRYPLKIGRGKTPLLWKPLKKNPQQGFLRIEGRAVMDGIDMLKTATYQFRSWSLEFVSQTLLGEGKIIHNAYDRLEEIKRLYREDKPALAHYNLQDCVLVSKIFDKTQLIEFAIERSQLTGLALDRMGGSVAAFTHLYLPKLHRAGYVAPNLDVDNWIPSPGGYVMDSKPGLYQSVIVLDFKSLYPSIIRTFCVDPMGLIEGLSLPIGTKSTQSIDGFRGGQFHRERHFLPKMIQTLWQARDEAKKVKNQPLSQAIKIIMNAFYGVLGSSGCRFFDYRLASSITMRGHEIMKLTKECIESAGYEVIYGDTDSTFVSLNGAFSAQDANKIGEILVKKINQWWGNHLQEKYGIESALEIEYENHYRRFFMPTIRGQEMGSKKRYAGLKVTDSGDQLIFKGLETVRTDWTPLAQQFQKILYERIFHDQPVEDFVKEYVIQTQSGAWDDRLVYRKQLRRHLSDYEKNVPPHVKAARLADKENDELGRPLQYQHRGWIEYVMTLHGAEPLEFQKHVMDYQHYLDKQLKPIADGILPFVHCDFDALIAPQMTLF